MPRLTPAELAHRATGMGSTDVVEAMGLAPSDGAGPMRLYMAKTDPLSVDDDATEEMDWGHVMEPVLVSWYEKQTGYKVTPGGLVTCSSEPWLWATLDGAVMGHSRNVECKNVGPAMAHHWDEYAEDGIPRYVRAQATIGMYCRNVELCDVVASVCGRPPHIWTVGYDNELGALLVDSARTFWRNVEARIPPPYDHTKSTKEYLRRKYPTNEDRTIVDADSALDDLGLQRVAAYMMGKRAEVTMDTLDAQIMDRIGKNDGVRGTGWKMTWKVGADGRRKHRFTVKGDGT